MNQIFTVLINSEKEVNDYLVPTGASVVLIDFNHKKMWMKSVAMNGFPEIREFDIKEKKLPGNSNYISRDEFNDKLSGLEEKIDKLITDLGGKK